MALDRKELDQIISTLNKYAEKKLTTEFLLKLDHEDRFPTEVLADLYNNIGLHLVFIGEEDDGLGGSAYDVYRFWEGPPVEAAHDVRVLVVAGEFEVPEKGRRMFLNMGIAMNDIALSSLVLDRALERGVGTTVEFP